MSPPANVLCVGRIYCDLLFSGVPSFPQTGEEVYANDLGIFAGGGAFISAAYLAATGIKPSLCGVLPNGPFGAAIDAEIKASNVDISACEQAKPSDPSQVTAIISTKKDRSFVTRRSGKALPIGFATALAAPKLTHLHIAELATLVEFPQLVPLAKKHRLSISLDCAWDDSVLAMQDVCKMLKGVDLFLPNEPELLKIANVGPDVALAARKISEMVPWMALKRGARGAQLWGQSRLLAEEIAAPQAVVDTTGAGDAFNAGFIGQWVQKANYNTCLNAGNVFGRAAVGYLGGATAAYRDTVFAPLRQSIAN